MKKNKKSSGKALIPVLILLIVIVVVVLFVTRGFKFGIGNGNSMYPDRQDNVKEVMATISEETSVTTVTTVTVEYVEVTVHENTYIFNNEVYELDDIKTLIDALNQTAYEYTVKITDDNASSKAYSQLLTAFDENKIEYIEMSE